MKEETGYERRGEEGGNKRREEGIRWDRIG
jgi:hypothetical protein